MSILQKSWDEDARAQYDQFYHETIPQLIRSKPDCLKISSDDDTSILYAKCAVMLLYRNRAKFENKPKEAKKWEEKLEDFIKLIPSGQKTNKSISDLYLNFGDQIPHIEQTSHIKQKEDHKRGLKGLAQKIGRKIFIFQSTKPRQERRAMPKVFAKVLGVLAISYLAGSSTIHESTSRFEQSEYSRPPGIVGQYTRPRSETIVISNRHEPSQQIVYQYSPTTVKQGDTVWSIIGETLTRHPEYSAQFDRLSTIQQRSVIGALTKKISSHPRQFGIISGDVDVISPGNKIQILSLLEDTAHMRVIFERAVRL